MLMMGLVIMRCTDPMAVNYDSNATISSECIYDQIGLGPHQIKG